MKSKTALLIGLCAFGLFTREAQAFSPQMTSIDEVTATIPNGYDEIDLHGDLYTNAGPNAIEAGVDDEEVYIQFNQNFGTVSISLYDALSNLIYQSNVNTGVQPIVIIPINSTEEGTFTLELNSINGGAEGGFDHNNN